MPAIQFIYLHGFSSGPQSNKALIFENRFKELGHHLLIPDLEGGDFRNLTITRQMDIIGRLLSGVSVDKFAIIGSSMGGYLALLTAQLQPLVKAVYLMCPGLNFVPRWAARLKKENPYWDKIPSLIDVFNYRYNKERSLSTVIFDDAVTWGQVSLDRVLPTRLVHGIHDEAVPIEESRSFARDRSWVDYMELDSDHGLLSHSEWIVDDCLEFFKREGLVI